MNSLEDILRLSQPKLFKRLCKKFKGKILISKGNFILVHGAAPILLVAHLDTVHEETVRVICKSDDGNILMSPQGIGGDDRCGVFALLKVYHAVKVKPYLLFTCDEEIGGLGAKKFCRLHKQKQLPKELDELKCIIEIDRRGANDAVYYDCDNIDFEDYISSKGFKTAQGSFSDISVIAPELGIAAVNLSSGYYNAHTKHEYINLAELDNAIQKVIEIISDVSKSDFPRFEYRERLFAKKIGYLKQPISETYFYEEWDNLPGKIPAEFRDIYEELLFEFSIEELESFRAEYGDNILVQLYHEACLSNYYDYNQK